MIKDIVINVLVLPSFPLRPSSIQRPPDQMLPQDDSHLLHIAASNDCGLIKYSNNKRQVGNIIPFKVMR